jgi:glycosyltransferase involved in cell wall biosynthesis
MKIGMILDAAFPPDYRVEKEAVTLSEAGHQVILFCLSTGHEKITEEYKGFLIVRYPTNLLEYKLSALAYTVPFYHWLMKRKIEMFIKTYKPDVLHVHDMVVAPAAIRTAHQKKIPVVLDLHENRPEIMKEYRHVNRFPGRLLINLKTWAKKQNQLIVESDKVVVVTELAKEDILKTTTKQPSDITVLPNTPSREFLGHSMHQNILERMEGNFNLLYIGDTSERRGTGDLVRAVGVLAERIPDLQLWIVGRSSFDRELIKLAEEQKVQSRIHFEGWQAEDLFPSYIHGAAICLSPLKRNQHHDTTYANKLFQYMAYSRPLIVSDCPAQAELIHTEKCGVVFRAGNVQDLAEAVMHLYLNPELRSEYGVNARNALIMRWSWELTSRELSKLYRNFAKA